MSFDETFQKLVDNYGLDVLKDIFKTRSILSDFVGNDIYGKKLINTLDIIYEVVDVRETFITLGLDRGRKVIGQHYKDVMNKCSKQEFIDTVNGFACVLCPIEYQEFKKHKLECQSKAKLNNVIRNKVVIKHGNPNDVNNVIVQNPNKANFKNNGILNKIKQNQFDSIKIMASNVRLNIAIDDNSTQVVKVYKNNKNYYNINDANLVNGKLEINLNRYHPQEITVLLPRKQYEELEIEGNELNIAVSGNPINHYSDNIEVRDIKIDTTNSYINLYNCNTQNLRINNTYGLIFCCGVFESIKVNNEHGYSSYYLSCNNLDNIDLDIKNTYGNVIINFNEGKVRPKITSFFKRENLIQKVGYVNSCKINFRLELDKSRAIVR